MPPEERPPGFSCTQTWLWGQRRDSLLNCLCRWRVDLQHDPLDEEVQVAEEDEGEAGGLPWYSRSGHGAGTSRIWSVCSCTCWKV